MNTNINIAEAFEGVRQFNDLAGNFDNVTDQSVDNQLSYIFEELSEAITAFEEGDRVEVLDGAADLFVTVAGLLQIMEQQGYDVNTALRRVNQNNMSKFPQVGESFSYGPDYNVRLNTNYARYVIKDSVGKVRKPNNFQGVYLTDLIPARSFA
jgi:NTP pyrophosphatase (non-canonical NTP hydrolase)